MARWQQLHGDHSFMEEWTGTDDGYYQLGVPPEQIEEAPAPAPAPAAPEPSPAAAATIAATIAAIQNGDVRIQESFKMNSEDTIGKCGSEGEWWLWE